MPRVRDWKYWTKYGNYAPGKPRKQVGECQGANMWCILKRGEGVAGVGGRREGAAAHINGWGRRCKVRREYSVRQVSG